ncbi:MAG: phenylacetate-CoA ligase [Chthoniobacter sp.]|jgi:phenylacetate-coenzyme A ligase PaaK-like adenylate-forming protein|nr:phenylacetate-CoA ligase [Chthoniobacter sp.]
MNHRSPWPSRPHSLREWQLARLRRYLRTTVLPFSAHYGALFRREGIAPAQLRTLDDLRRIPFTTKKDFLPGVDGADPVRDFVLQPDPAVLSRRPATLARALLHGRHAVAEGFEREFRPLLMTSTTGRSAEPVPFLYTEHDIDNLRLGGARVYEICGSTREMRMLNLFPFAPHLAFWFAHYGGAEFGVFVLGTGGGKTMGTDGNLRLIRKIKPDTLMGMPTFLYHVLTELAHDGFALPNLRKIVLGGEKAPSGMRRKLRALAGELGATHVDVLRTYGFTEAKMAWTECPYNEDAGSAGYHIHPDLALIEIVDPKTGEPRREGEPGEIVCTPLDARGSVVLRYRTGDCTDGGLFYEQCPFCGRRVPRLVGEISRNSEIRDLQLDKLKGTLVDFNQLEHVLDNAEHVQTWQLELRKRHDDPLELDELILHVTKSDDIEDDPLREALNARFVSETELHPNRIELHSLDEMRRLQGVGVLLKEQRVVDHRPKGDAGLPSGSARQTMSP